MDRIRRYWLYVAATVLSVIVPPARADAMVTNESQLKAAYIYNFAKFVTWPEDAADSDHDTITICTMGSQAIDSELAKVDNKRAAGKLINVRPNVGDATITECHILYIGHDISYSDVLARSQSAHVLTIGEGASFIEEGGVIAFDVDGQQRHFLEQAKIRIEINRGAAERSNLHISARLLQVAAKVHEK